MSVSMGVIGVGFIIWSLIVYHPDTGWKQLIRDPGNFEQNAANGTQRF
jgi:hypothetical protein